jgi:hypothetical protein
MGEIRDKMLKFSSATHTDVLINSSQNVVCKRYKYVRRDDQLNKELKTGWKQQYGSEGTQGSKR